MKPYTKINWEYVTRYNGGYEIEYIYWRHPKTFNEIRQNCAAKADGHKVRGRRMNIPTCWDDLSISQIYGKDWKRYTKRRHQWK